MAKAWCKGNFYASVRAKPSHLFVKRAVEYEDDQTLKRIKDGEYVLEYDGI